MFYAGSRKTDYGRNEKNCKRARHKSKGANLPQSWRPTLQSQFSQGESMNERMLSPF